MLTFFRKFRNLSVLAVAALAVAALVGVTSQSDAANGTVRLRVTNAGFIVGMSGGSGTLTFQGRSYPLTIGGLNVGAIIGAASADFVGEARNLRSASDIVGTYTAVGGGVAIAGGAAGVTLQNSNGVVLRLRGKQIGVQFSLGLSGMQISMR